MKKLQKLRIISGTLTAYVGLSFSAFAAGTSQSPVDFSPATTTFNPLLPALNYNYASSVGLNVANTGSPDHEESIKSTITSGTANLVLSGVTYNLVQFHFHTESEHTLNSAAFPMELHLVHQQVGMTGTDGLLVTGRWVTAGAENIALSDIFSSLPAANMSRNIASYTGLPSLLPASLTSYRYSGSLTTHHFDEPVQWIFLDTPLEMSTAQINSFKALFPTGNSRDVQPLNSRQILTDVVPEPGSLALFVMGSVFLLCRPRRSWSG